jgi:hypothetical protein
VAEEKIAAAAAAALGAVLLGGIVATLRRRMRLSHRMVAVAGLVVGAVAVREWHGDPVAAVAAP